MNNKKIKIFLFSMVFFMLTFYLGGLDLTKRSPELSISIVISFVYSLIFSQLGE